MYTIIDIEPIIWETWSPHDVKSFPCFVCREKIATIFMKLQKNVVIIKLPVCESCSKKEAANIETNLHNLNLQSGVL